MLLKVWVSYLPFVHVDQGLNRSRCSCSARDPCAKFVIPEFPTLIAWIVVIMVPSSVALFASKKIRPKVN